MSVPVVLRPEATKDTAEAIGYFDTPRFMASSGGMYVLRGCGGLPMLFITVSTRIVWRCWPWSRATVTLRSGRVVTESPSRPNFSMASEGKYAHQYR